MATLLHESQNQSYNVTMNFVIMMEAYLGLLLHYCRLVAEARSLAISCCMSAEALILLATKSNSATPSKVWTQLNAT